MSEPLQEFVSSRGAALAVDRQAGWIRGVKILGLHSRNGRTYRESGLARGASLYEGAKVNVNHARGAAAAPRDYQDRIGVLRGVRFESGRGLFGDLQINPKHALAEQLFWDAEHAPENVGLSHNVEARTSREAETLVVEEIVRVQSVDLVADPAATRGLFEDEASEEERETLRAEVARLREECDSLRQRTERAARAESLRRWLAEFGLPDPEVDREAARRLIDAQFLEEFQQASGDAAARALVARRAELVRAAAEWRGRRPGETPRAVEQRWPSEATWLEGERFDAESYARSLK